MPFLGDYLGQLLSELAMARMRADLESVRIAELYASHPLLKTMPVPHIRLPEVNIDVPVLVRGAEPSRGDQPPRGGLDAARVAATFDTLLTTQFARAGVQVSDADRVKLRGTIAERIGRSELPAEVSGDVQRVSDEMTGVALEFLRASRGRRALGPELIKQFADDLRADARVALLKLRSAPPRLDVGVTSDEIRNEGTTENVTHLRLRIAEHGLEWVSIEGEGGARDRLVQE